MKRQFRIYSSKRIVAGIYDEHPTTIEGVADYILKLLGSEESGVYGYSIRSNQITIRGLRLRADFFTVRTCSFSEDEISNIANDSSSATSYQLISPLLNRFFYDKDKEGDYYEISIDDMSLDEIFEGFDKYDFSSSYAKKEIEFALENGMSEYMMYNNQRKSESKKNPSNFSQLLNKLISSVRKHAEDVYGFNIDVKQTKNTITWSAYEGNPSPDNLVSYFKDNLAEYKHGLDDLSLENWAYSIVNELANDDSGEVHKGPKF